MQDWRRPLVKFCSSPMCGRGSFAPACRNLRPLTATSRFDGRGAQQFLAAAAMEHADCGGAIWLLRAGGGRSYSAGGNFSEAADVADSHLRRADGGRVLRVVDSLPRREVVLGPDPL